MRPSRSTAVPTSSGRLLAALLGRLLRCLGDPAGTFGADGVQPRRSLGSASPTRSPNPTRSSAATGVSRTPRPRTRANRLAHYLAARGIGARRPRRRCSSTTAPSTSRHARGVEAARGADQRQLPLHGRGAAVPARRLRRQGDRVPRRVRTEARGDRATRSRCSPLPRGRRHIRVERRRGARPRRAISVRSTYEAALARRVARRATSAPARRRQVHPLHRRHHREAEGRHVAGRGHLLRRARRREPRRAPIARPRRSPSSSTAGRRRYPHARSCTAPRTGSRSARSTPAARSSLSPDHRLDPRSALGADRARAGHLPRHRRRRFARPLVEALDTLDPRSTCRR